MRQCLRCKKVGFWFQFHSEFRGIYTATYDVCKACARALRNQAVDEYQERVVTRRRAGEAA